MQICLISISSPKFETFENKLSGPLHFLWKQAFRSITFHYQVIRWTFKYHALDKELIELSHSEHHISRSQGYQKKQRTPQQEDVSRINRVTQSQWQRCKHQAKSSKPQRRGYDVEEFADDAWKVLHLKLVQAVGDQERCHRYEGLQGHSNIPYGKEASRHSDFPAIYWWLVDLQTFRKKYNL